MVYNSDELNHWFGFARLSEGKKVLPVADECRDVARFVKSLESKISLSDQKAAIRLEKDKARMAQVFLELDEDADGL